MQYRTFEKIRILFWKSIALAVLSKRLGKTPNELLHNLSTRGQTYFQHLQAMANRDNDKDQIQKVLSSLALLENFKESPEPTQEYFSDDAKERIKVT